MKKLTHIFFDLDHTLWDYDASSTQALTELYDRYRLDRMFTSATAFIRVFHHVNGGLWDRFNRGEIDREYIRSYRFAEVLSGRMDPDEDMARELSDFFIDYCPRLPNLIEGSLEVLKQLHGQYTLGIISNGFEDTQAVKLSQSGIDHFFQYVITSESAGYRKPDPAIFDHALELSSANADEVIMIGDNLSTDIAGATAAGWRSIWYCPEEEAGEQVHRHEPVIRDLREIPELVSS